MLVEGKIDFTEFIKKGIFFITLNKKFSIVGVDSVKENNGAKS